MPASTARATTEGNDNGDGPSVSLSPPPPVGTTSTPMLPGDPALWPPFTEQLREEALYRGPAAFHNRPSQYPASARESGLGSSSWTRCLANDLLHCRLQNNQMVPREWLLYSPSTGSMRCYACRLLSSQRHLLSDSVVGNIQRGLVVMKRVQNIDNTCRTYCIAVNPPVFSGFLTYFSSFPAVFPF